MSCGEDLHATSCGRFSRHGGRQERITQEIRPGLRLTPCPPLFGLFEHALHGTQRVGIGF